MTVKWRRITTWSMKSACRQITYTSTSCIKICTNISPIRTVRHRANIVFLLIILICHFH
jgi:hypothetical protein